MTKLTNTKTDARLDGVIALVTGACGGIGQAVARRFVDEGARVMLSDIDTSHSQTVRELGSAGAFVALDVRETSQWANAVVTCGDVFGGTPSALVLASGVMVSAPLETAEPDQFRLAFEVNVLGALYGMQAVLPGMRAQGGGSIVVLSSATGPLIRLANLGAYGASKAANAALAQTAAIEFGPVGVRVNSIVPGGVDTPMSRASTLVDASAFYKRLPVPRIGNADDIASAAVYLCSEESAYITGTNFVVDGGLTAGLIVG
jgi:3alpha(or 20beta)-hydroxysteroid dehydrogenase